MGDDGNVTRVGGPFGVTYDHSPRLNLLAMVRRQIVQFDLLDGIEYSVGRADNSAVQLNDPSVSRHHASLSQDGAQVAIVDRGSRNGTFLNGTRLDREVESLASVGDVLRFGDVIVQIQHGAISRSEPAGLLHADDFERLLFSEADRLNSGDKDLSVVAIAITEPPSKPEGLQERRILDCFSQFGAITRRSRDRYDLLAAERSAEEARDLALRALDRLSGASVHAKAGIASFPTSVPSVESLCVAAQLALHQASTGEISMSEPGARRVKLPSREIWISDPIMLRLFRLIERAALSKAPALVHGDTGTGKEVFAEALHALGRRAKKPLIKINCAAVPESLIESELFGHDKGAFTGATAAKTGLFEQANGGTIFLDEIGDMPMALQSKLLRVLDDGEIRPVGGSESKKLDVRVVAATHRDLPEAVAGGRFRQDLYYRISSIVLEVPPLKTRPKDVAVLAEKFLKEQSEHDGVPAPKLSAEAIKALCSHDWPGNIRELRNVISSSLLHCDGNIIEESDLQFRAIERTETSPSTGASWGDDTVDSGCDQPLEDELKSLEKNRIVEALRETGYNQTQAAKLLKMPRRTLVYKLRSLNIEVPRRRARTQAK